MTNDKKVSGSLVLGLDSSTQSLSAVVLDIATKSIVLEHSISYANDSRLNIFGLDPSTMIFPPSCEGQANQSPLLFVASLEAMMDDLYKSVDLFSIKAISISAQQHGHVYLNKESDEHFACLCKDSTVTSLKDKLQNCFSYPYAPIWKTSCTKKEADYIRDFVGGKEKIIELSGSDSPLRFSGAVVRYVGSHYPKEYQNTKHIFLINTFLNAILTGNTDQKTDFGNGAGTSLQNYNTKQFDDLLMEAVSKDLPGGKEELKNKIGMTTHPLSTSGTVCSYFVKKYNFNSNCIVSAGSGDNPQTKSLFNSSILSLGTSFVYMVNQDTKTRDYTGSANSMYDGLGRPFLFACRTNGAMVWDRVRKMYNKAPTDFSFEKEALQKYLPGSVLRFYQPDNETFPLSRAFKEIVRKDNKEVCLESDYAGIVDSTLAMLYKNGCNFEAKQDSSKALCISGGPSKSKAIVDRIASLWNRPVKILGGIGASLGAAISACASISYNEHHDEEKAIKSVEELCSCLLEKYPVVMPDSSLVEAWHKKGLDGKNAIERINDSFYSML